MPLLESFGEQAGKFFLSFTEVLIHGFACFWMNERIVGIWDNYLSPSITFLFNYMCNENQCTLYTSFISMLLFLADDARLPMPVPNTKSVLCLCATCANPSVKFTLSLHHLKYLMQCKCCLNDCHTFKEIKT